MRGSEFIEKFGLIDEKYIEEAEEKTTRKNIRIPILIAACFMLVLLVAALPFFIKEAQQPDVPKVHTAVDTTERPEVTYTPSRVYDGIPYSELDISDTELDPALNDLVGGSAMLADFVEEDLVHATAVIEGRVVGVRTKLYNILTDHDKFGDGCGTRYFENSVVYDIEVEKVYMGKIDADEIFTVEVRVVAPRYTFHLKEGHSYVIPVRKVDEEWGFWQGNVVEGSTERDSMNSILYSYHPQIERTEDGYYIFSDDWTTLASSEAALRVTMDVPYDKYKQSYNDKMMLIDSVNFEKCLEEILAKYSK